MPPKKNPTAKSPRITAKLLAENAVELAEYAARVLIAAEELGIKTKRIEHFWLAPAQREILLAVPGISRSIKTKLAKDTASFSFAEVAGMTMALAEASIEAESRKHFAILLVARHLLERLHEGIVPFTEPKKVSHPKAIKDKADPNTVFQFKITLIGAKPAIWRRMQVQDCTLDKLHEHIQTSMGWTNSHLHDFRVGEQLYGHPMLLHETMNELKYKASTRTKISTILPKTGKQFRFVYEYDFGDCWEHEVLFEGRPKKEPGQKYPLCLEGERACPPEDVGGIGGYEDFLEAIRNRNYEEREVMFEWTGGWFDPEEFDPLVATKSMKKGLPDWRE